jgi:hypothetical protein
MGHFNVLAEDVTSALTVAEKVFEKLDQRV